MFIKNDLANLITVDDKLCYLKENNILKYLIILKLEINLMKTQPKSKKSKMEDLLNGDDQGVSQFFYLEREYQIKMPNREVTTRNFGLLKRLMQ